MQLVHKDTGLPAKAGDKLKDFRGSPAVLVSTQEPPAGSNSTGRVFVREIETTGVRGYYPSVYNLVFVEDGK